MLFCAFTYADRPRSLPKCCTLMWINTLNSNYRKPSVNGWIDNNIYHINNSWSCCCFNFFCRKFSTRRKRMKWNVALCSIRKICYLTPKNKYSSVCKKISPWLDGWVVGCLDRYRFVFVIFCFDGVLLTRIMALFHKRTTYYKFCELQTDY